MAQPGWSARSSDERLTPVMRRVLPSLRIYSAWMTCSFSILTEVHDNASKFFESLRNDMRQLWSIFARALSILTESFTTEELPTINYLLEEDSETIGFIPFQTPTLKQRYLDGNYRKPNRFNVVRHHPNKEMLGRIRDLISEGLKLADREVSPLEYLTTACLSNRYFIRTALSSSPTRAIGQCLGLKRPGISNPLFRSTIAAYL